MRNEATVCLLGLTLALVAGCAGLTPKEQVPVGTDPKLSRTTYFEEGAIIFLAVDVNAARMLKKGSIFPLPVMLVNKTKKAIRLNTEDFNLVDSANSRYPLLSYEMYRKHYRRVNADEKLTEMFYEITNQRLSIDGSFLSTFERQDMPFYGQQGGRSDYLELGPRHYARGFLYFSVPESGLWNQVLELHVSSDDLPDTVFVRFEVK